MKWENVKSWEWQPASTPPPQYQLVLLFLHDWGYMLGAYVDGRYKHHDGFV